MPQYYSPGVYIQEVSTGARPIQPVGTSTAGFLGVAPDSEASKNQAVALSNFTDFQKNFLPKNLAPDAKIPSNQLASAVWGFFENGGSRCYVVNVGNEGGKPAPIVGSARERKGINVLETIDEVAIVAAPGYWDAGSHNALIDHCEKLGDRVAILDPPDKVDDIQPLKEIEEETPSGGGGGGGGGGGVGAAGGGGKPKKRGMLPRQTDRGFAAFYFPWITIRDPFNPAEPISVPPSGHIAGVYARTDSTRGVHKAPANESIRGVLNVAYNVTRGEQDELNPLGVNCIRLFSREGVRIWGARTRAAAASEWRYLNVRRLFNMIEESIALSTRWVVFEPNDPTLWKSIRRDVGAFLRSLWRDGALMGASPEEAFFVKCDEETNPTDEIDQGKVTTVVGVAPVKPAEFVSFKIGQSAGGVEREEA